MKKKIFAFVIFSVLVILIAQAVSAFTFINIFVDETGEAIFLGETDEVISLPAGIEVIDGEIEGFTSAITNKQGEIWSIDYELPGAELTLILPRGTIIKNLGVGEVSLSGERISVYFQDAIEITYIVEKSTIPEATEVNIPLLMVLIAILLILIVYLINYTNREKREEKKEKQIPPKPKKRIRNLDIIKQVLSDREKLILEKLEKTGKVKSSYLRKLTEIPKASFSRHIQELEKKKLIKRTGEGRNKFIMIIRK